MQKVLPTGMRLGELMKRGTIVYDPRGEGHVYLLSPQFEAHLLNMGHSAEDFLSVMGSTQHEHRTIGGLTVVVTTNHNIPPLKVGAISRNDYTNNLLQGSYRNDSTPLATEKRDKAYERGRPLYERAKVPMHCLIL